jgi:hypothetical protein
MVGTTEAASLLGISTRRLVALLNEKRVYGAYKIGRIWVIPLVNGLPKITKSASSRGPKPKWEQVKPPAQTVIHINRHFLGQKDKDGNYLPVITVKKGGENTYCHRVHIPGPCEVVYNFEKGKYEAKAWIETFVDTFPVDGCKFKDVKASRAA